MSQFVSEKTRDIYLGEGESVSIRVSIGYEQILPFMQMQKEGKPDIELMVPLLSVAISSWNLKDDEGQEVPLNDENIKKLKLETILKLGEEITDQYFPSKKDSGLSKE